MAYRLGKYVRMFPTVNTGSMGSVELSTLGSYLQGCTAFSYKYASAAVAELTHCSQPMYRLRKRPGNGSERERGTPSIWDSSEAWAACAKALREYDEAMIQDWKEEIDTLLVFVSTLVSSYVSASAPA